MLKINKITSASTVDYAAEELKRYLRMMRPEGGDVQIAYAPDAKDGFRLGLMEQFGLDTSDAEDPKLDDVLYIDCDTEGGIIAGSNVRSVLLAVYEYLRQMGCRWLFPGIDGEYIPMKELTPVKYRKKADSRIRGTCIEGYESQRILFDYIEFMPKVGLNTFMMQFRIPSVFYRNYYNHWRNGMNRTPEPVSIEQAASWCAGLECEIAKRSLSFHAYGHGFTTDPFGIDSAIGDGTADPEDYKDQMQYYALLNGKRLFYQDRPVNTQLCLTNAVARKKVADYVVKYAKRHTNVDYLHIWMADSGNNHCECEECSKYRPSDLYVKLMNEIDDALTEANMDTKLVAIVYSDALWAPLTEKINKSSRFTMMLAPIARDFASKLDLNALPKVAPYVRNKLTDPEDFGEIIAHYNEWRKDFDGERFVFDYHFWWHQDFDITGLGLAKHIYEDIDAYRSLGMSGIVGCGSQRAFFPNGYYFYTFARYLFDATLTLDQIREDYFSHAYGKCYKDVFAALSAIDEALPYSYVAPMQAKKRPEHYATADAPDRIARARAAREGLIEVVKANYNSPIRITTAAIRILECFCTYLDVYTDVLEAVSRNDRAAADAAMRRFRVEAGKIEFYAEACYDHGQAAGMVENYIVKSI